MQIAGFNKDTLADGSGKAAISWISKELLATRRRMNPARAGDSGNHTEGTGSIGGWEKSELRSVLKGTIKPLIPESVQSAIKSVSKQQAFFRTDGKHDYQTTEDDVWLPTRAEINDGIYDLLFTDSASRIKYTQGATSALWWLRDPNLSPTFYKVDKSGDITGYPADSSEGVVLCFCT